VVKDLDIEARQMGHRAECDLCGEMDDYKRTIPNGQEELYYQHCWADAYGAPERFTDYN